MRIANGSDKQIWLFHNASEWMTDGTSHWHSIQAYYFLNTIRAPPHTGIGPTFRSPQILSLIRTRPAFPEVSTFLSPRINIPMVSFSHSGWQMIYAKNLVSTTIVQLSNILGLLVAN